MAGINFDVIRNRVSARDAAIMYGLHINERGKALCPWHKDRHPSLSFKDGYCNCFACNKGGGSIELASQLLKLSPYEAGKRLILDFGIADAGVCLNAEEVQKRRVELLRAQAERVEQKEDYFTLCTVIELADGKIDALIRRDGMNANIWKYLAKRTHAEQIRDCIDEGLMEIDDI